MRLPWLDAANEIQTWTCIRHYFWLLYPLRSNSDQSEIKNNYLEYYNIFAWKAKSRLQQNMPIL